MQTRPEEPSVSQEQTTCPRQKLRSMCWCAWILLLILFPMCLVAHWYWHSNLQPDTARLGWPLSLCIVPLLVAVIIKLIYDTTEEYYRLVNVDKIALASKFSGWAAHQIRNPLAVVRAQAQAMAHGPLDRSQIEVGCQRIIDNADTIATITRQFLDLVHPLHVETETLDVRSLLQFVVAQYSSIHPGIHFKIEGHFIPVEGHEALLKEAFNNILDNAVKSLREEGTIILRGGQQRARLRLDIIDDGSGIPSRYLRRVTETGFSTRRQGTGLGLAITCSVIDMHKGDLSIRSREGVGTTVTILLPASPVRSS